MKQLGTEGKKTAVVTIDIQRDYFPGGRFPLYRPGRALKNARRVLDAARAEGLKIFHVRHENSAERGRFLFAGTKGAELHSGLGIRESEAIVLKHEPDSFLGTELEKLLRDEGIEEVIWMGMMTWMCVDTTVRSAYARGFKNILVEDACASGWMLKNGLPIFPWASQRAYIAALGYNFARVVRAPDCIG